VPTYVVFYNGVVYGYTAVEPPGEADTIVLDRGGDTVRVTSVRFGDNGTEVTIYVEAPTSD
jgi:hexokinase